MSAPLGLRATLLGRCHHCLHFTDTQNEVRAGEATCSVRGNNSHFLGAELMLLTLLSTTYLFLSFDNLMRGVSTRQRRTPPTSCQLWLVPCQPDLYPNFWTHFQHLHWLSHSCSLLTRPKQTFFSFTPKSATPIVFSISIDCPSIHPLAEAKISSIRNRIEEKPQTRQPFQSSQLRRQIWVWLLSTLNVAGTDWDIV